MSKQDFDKIGKMLADTGNTKLEEFDIVFLIDATGSMESYIEAAKCTAEDLSKILRQKFPETNFQYGYVFYRDPIDSFEDIHEIINLTDNVNSLPQKIGKINAKGGGDMPEDWAGAFKKVNEEIEWRNGNKVIFHLADAGAHGKLFTPYDKYPDEEQKLIKELEICCEKKVKIFGFVIEEDSRNSFEKCKDIYKNKGGFYEIYNFKKPEGVLLKKHSIFDDYYKHSDIAGCGLFENKESKSIFERNGYNPFREINDNNMNTSHKSLFGSNKKINSFFGNNNNTKSLFGNINENSKCSIFENIKENNSKKNGLFSEKKENNHHAYNLFGSGKENRYINDTGSLFKSNIENNNNAYNLFENNNKDTGCLFGNNIEKNNNSYKLFGDDRNNNIEMNYQSQLNSSFLNIVVNSIQNINKN